MKRIVASFAVLIALSGCSDSGSVPESQSIQITADFSSKTSDFAFDFWKAYEQEHGAEGYFLSPLSLNVALGLLLNGTEGETRKEIQTALGFSDADLATINASYAEIISKLPNVDYKVTNQIANSVWHDKDFSVKEEYLSELKKSFSAEVFSENFGDAATVQKINKWASDNTNAKIKKVLDKIDAGQVLFLMNALYFKGDWTQKFDVKNTQKGNFYGEKNLSTVDLMQNFDTFGYFKNEELEMVELPYGNEKYALIAVLPVNGKIADVINGMTAQKWKESTSALVKQKVEVVLPKFQLETSKELSSVLAKLGIQKVFTPAAELGKISDYRNLLVGSVKQDTYLGVDEKGSEAAAVTTIGVEVTSMPSYRQFVCDKPFAFAIVEKTSNTIQFIGKVTDL